MNTNCHNIEKFDKREQFSKIKELWDSCSDKDKVEIIKHVKITSEVFRYNDNTYNILGINKPIKWDSFPFNCLKCKVEVDEIDGSEAWFGVKRNVCGDCWVKLYAKIDDPGYFFEEESDLHLKKRLI